MLFSARKVTIVSLVTIFSRGTVLRTFAMPAYVNSGRRSFLVDPVKQTSSDARNVNVDSTVNYAFNVIWNQVGRR